MATSNATSVAALKKDPRINKAFDKYADGLKGSEAMLYLMDDIVTVFAKTKNYKDDEDSLNYLAEREQEIRLAHKREVGRLTTRDEKGVSSSEFKGVLKLAKMDGGLTCWQSIVKAGRNWTRCKQLASKARTFASENKNKLPGGRWFDTELKALQKRSAGTAKEKAPATAPELVSGMIEMAKDFRQRFGKKIDVVQVTERVLSMLHTISLQVDDYVGNAALKGATSKRRANVADLEAERKKRATKKAA